MKNFERQQWTVSLVLWALLSVAHMAFSVLLSVDTWATKRVNDQLDAYHDKVVHPMVGQMKACGDTIQRLGSQLNRCAAALEPCPQRWRGDAHGRL